MPIQPVIKAAFIFAQKNPQMILQVVQGLGLAGSKVLGGGKTLVDEMGVAKKKKLDQGGFPHLKEKKIIFQTEIMKQLPEKKRKELFFYLLEIEDIIGGYEAELETMFKKNPKYLLKNKELRTWISIHQTISNAMNNLDFEELLLHYHNQDYKSDYFEGFNLIVETLDEYISKGDKDKIHYFIKEVTDKPINKIRKHFI